MDFSRKILTRESLPAWRAQVKAAGRKLVVTNGCFDLLHLGHVTYLQAARNQGDLLLVGVNSDASVRSIKGPTRPINPEGDRLSVIAALESVDAVCLFPEPTALEFLTLAQPDIWVKGGEFNVDTVPQVERNVVESIGGRIMFVPMVPGRSTTNLVNLSKGKAS